MSKILIEKFAFDTTARPPIYCAQTLVKTSDGLEHSIDGTLRAMVPELHVAEYLDSVNVRQMLTDSEYELCLGEFTDFN